MTSTFPTEHQPSRRKTSAPDAAAAERQLARWIAEGDEAALAELFDLVGPTLHAVALGISEDTRHADAAVEETFAELWEKRAGLGRLPVLSPWLLERCRAWAIALREGTPVPRSKGLHDRAGDVPLTRRLLRCPSEIRLARISAALDGLDEAEREVLMVASRAGLSVAELGTRIGRSPDEVHRLLRRGLDRVRETLERTLRRETV
ncbi:MAG TPA: sigma factor-like helix-turn-helix DNA-binding protein [Gemmatimonadales bacterium]|nr:sigma factor-like helix-turn-helix DNA-binding protein [Gemmatimonadales bacterium]